MQKTHEERMYVYWEKELNKLGISKNFFSSMSKKLNKEEYGSRKERISLFMHELLGQNIEGLNRVSDAASNEFGKNNNRFLASDYAKEIKNTIDYYWDALIGLLESFEGKE